MNRYIQWFLFILFLFTLSINAQSFKTEDIVSQSTYQSPGYRAVRKIGNVNAVIIYCAFKSPPAPGYTSYIDSLPYWYSQMGPYIQSYIRAASNNQQNITFTVLVDTVKPSGKLKPFIGNYDFDNTAPYVLSKNFTLSVLDSVNKKVDLSKFDNDGPDGIPNSGDDDGYVDYVFFVVLWPLDRGGGGLNIDNNFGAGGDYVTSWPSQKPGFGNIRISGAPNAATQNIIYKQSPILLHEYGHSAGGFPDIDHNYFGYFNHYSIGSFDVMAHVWGFNNVPSVYNPYFRDEYLGWLTPTTVSANSTKQLTDLLNTGLVYKYVPSIPSNAYPGEEFYISYHTGSNSWERYWPMDHNYGGVLIWRADGYGYPSSNDIGNSICYPQLISIEAAHGKWKWTEYPDSVHNTGVQDALTGFDSLEIRKMVNNTEVEGPYYNKDVGSSSVFFTPNLGQDFAFYTNPNSNLIYQSFTQKFAHNILNGFAVKNIRTVNGSAYADFYFDNYTITSNATLTAGNWYINNSVIIASGVTVTVQPGVTLNFTNGASLTVNGTLNIPSGSSLTINNGTVVINNTLISHGNINIPSGSSFTINLGANINFNNYSSFVLNGNLTIPQNITFDAGSSFTANPGAHIYSYTNQYSPVIIVNGSFNAIGTSANMITFDIIPNPPFNTVWGGILFNPGSSGTVQYCNINNAAVGVFCNNTSSADPISNNNFYNNMIAINAEYCSPHICYNNISNNSYLGSSGISCYSAGPSIYFNKILPSYPTGIDCNLSSPWLGNVTVGPPPGPGHNILKSRNYGVVAGYDSQPFIGFTSAGGINSIWSFWGIDAWYNDGLTIYAQNNWWNNDPYFVLVETNLIYLPDIEGPDPNANNPKIAGVEDQPISDLSSGELFKVSSLHKDNLAESNINKSSISIKDSAFDDQMGQILTLELQGNYDAAVNQYKQKFRSESLNNHKRRVLVSLAWCYKRAGKNGFIDFLNSEVRPNIAFTDSMYATSLELENLFLINDKNYKKAEDNFTLLKNNFANNEAAYKSALYGLWNLHYFLIKDTAKAGAYLNELRNRFPNDMLTTKCNIMLGSFNNTSLNNNHGLNKKMNNEPSGNNLDSYSLDFNHPNPFNPTTVINYQIPNDGFVTLKVYDILGKEVKTLVNEFQAKGKYSLSFDASRLASGIYFYQMRAGNFSSTKKMILTK